jgi:hypothetical protein
MRLVHAPFALAALATSAAAQSFPHLYRVGGTNADAQLGFAVCCAGDIDHDGRPDLAAGAIHDRTPQGISAGSVSAYSSATGVRLWTAYGEGTGDRYGWAVAPVGDFDGDGWPDVVAGAHKNDGAGTDAGMARILSGRDGSTLRTFRGEAPNDFFGHCVAGVGDVTGDGVPDIGVGAWQARPAGDSSGSAYVISGADGSVVWRFDGTAQQHRVGFSMWSAGDIDGDGRDDVIVGATGQTSVYVLRGTDGAVLLHLQGETPGDSFGYSVRSADDVDGDSVPDVMVGALKAYGFRGYARVYSGATGVLLHHVEGDGSTDVFGTSIVGFGDVDGDGYGEFAAGGFHNSGNGHDSGITRIYSGRSGAVLATLFGNSGNDWFGYALAKLGDVDLDGVPDLAIAANLDNAGAASGGSVNVYSGTLFGTGSTFCAGDANSSACPCGNASPTGWMQGCRNSTSRGGMLRASGTPSVSNDNVMLEVSGLPNSAPTLIFQGTSALGSAVPFGDGLRCVGGAILRLGIRNCLYGHLQLPRLSGTPISVLGEVAANGIGTRHYQAYYRNLGSPCGTGFNITNGVSLTWTP